MSAAVSSSPASSSDVETFVVKVHEVRNLELDKKKSVDIWVRAKSPATGATLRTTPVDSSRPAWNGEEMQFALPPSKRTSAVTFKLCCKGYVTDDVIAQADVVLANHSGEICVAMEKRKGKGELRISVSSASASAVGSGADNKTGGAGTMDEKYTLGKEIGRGGFSVVYDAVEKAGGRKVAVKIIDKKKQDAEQLRLLEREITIMQKLKHPSIVELYDVYNTPTHIQMVMEFVSGGELYDQIIARGSFTEHDAATLMKQVLSATAYMHENGIAHRDLKPENLLLSSSKADEIKIADFGLSKDFSGADAMTTCCGSPSYVAPEVLQQGEYSNACDIWSMGVILYVLLCGFLPFFGDTQEELFDKILSGTFSFNHKCWDDVTPIAKDLVGKMLTLAAGDRPSAKQCLAHAWFSVANPRRQLTSVASLRDLRAATRPKPVAQ